MSTVAGTRIVPCGGPAYVRRVTETHRLLNLAVEHAAAAVSALALAEDVRWAGTSANRYRLILSELRIRAVAVAGALAAERDAAAAWDTDP